MNLAHTTPLVNSLHLSFSNHIHRFDPAQRSSCGIECLKSIIGFTMHLIAL
jgi:hypothetical protein